MKLYGHIIASLLLLLFYPIFGNMIFISMIASIFADIDHISYLFNEKRITFKKIKYLLEKNDYHHAKNKKNLWKGVLFLFHTLEFNILLFVLAIIFNSPVLSFIAFGFVFHIATDIIHHSARKFPLLRWLFFVNWLRNR